MIKYISDFLFMFLIASVCLGQTVSPTISDVDSNALNQRDVAPAKNQAATLISESSAVSDVVQESSLAETIEPTPHWIPAPQPKADSRNLSFDIYSVYENSASGSDLFSIADLYANRKLDENSTTADLQVRFSKNLSSSDSTRSHRCAAAKAVHSD